MEQRPGSRLLLQERRARHSKFQSSCSRSQSEQLYRVCTLLELNFDQDSELREAMIRDMFNVARIKETKTSSNFIFIYILWKFSVVLVVSLVIEIYDKHRIFGLELNNPLIIV